MGIGLSRSLSRLSFFVARVWRREERTHIPGAEAQRLVASSARTEVRAYLSSNNNDNS